MSNRSISTGAKLWRRSLTIHLKSHWTKYLSSVDGKNVCKCWPQRADKKGVGVKRDVLGSNAAIWLEKPWVIVPIWTDERNSHFSLVVEDLFLTPSKAILRLKQRGVLMGHSGLFFLYFHLFHTGQNNF